MSYTSKETYTTSPNFLASEVGLRAESRTIPVGMGVQQGQFKIVPAGTIFPANDGTAVGVIFEDVDVTNGDHAGSVMIGGHIYKNRLPVVPAAGAITAMQAVGLYFEDAVGMERG
jgi:hypothetical protein